MRIGLDSLVATALGNPRRASALKRFGILTVRDALTYYPFRVSPPVPVGSFRQAKLGEPIAVHARIAGVRGVPLHVRSGSRVEVMLDDSDFWQSAGARAEAKPIGPGTAQAVFFSYKKNYVSWLLGKLHQGDEVIICGSPSLFNNSLQFAHPEILVIGTDADSAAAALEKVTRPTPVYHASAHFSSERIHECIGQLINLLETQEGAGSGESEGAGEPSAVPTILPASVRRAIAQEWGWEAEPGDQAVSPWSVLQPANPQSTGEIELVGETGPAAGQLTSVALLPLPLTSRLAVFKAIHQPDSVERFRQAIQLMRFEEAFISQLSLLRSRQEAEQDEAFACPLADWAGTVADWAGTAGRSGGEASSGSASGPTGRVAGKASGRAVRPVDDCPDRSSASSPVASPSLVARLLSQLPFDLTEGQQEVFAQIRHDLAAAHPMHRLLQGEVGSGKTLVALLALLQVVDAGYQAVLVAPTQVLAEQHFQTISGYLDGLGAVGTGADGTKIDGTGVGLANGGTETADQAKTGRSDDTDTAGTGTDEVGATALPVGRTGSDEAALAAGRAGAVTGDSGLPPVFLLTSGLKLAQRRRILAYAASGQPCIVIATHAAFSKSFQIPRLALAVIDEQHRFGVEQRDSLADKSERSPHLLVMTATPIPRTAAMTWFGDLDISELKGLPGGRQPIATHVIPEADSNLMATMLWHLRKRIDAGERAYVVCPAIDDAAAMGDSAAASAGAEGSAEFAGTATGTDGVADGAGSRSGARHGAGRDAVAAEDSPDYVDLFTEGGDVEGEDDQVVKPPLHSVQEMMRRFADLPQFQGIQLASLTGRDDEATKARVMADFAAGTSPLLVSTTVIEVGVDVPTASCIVIFDADRFGLSQLHQLRGRVGRGGTPGWAFLVSRAEPDSVAAQRLEVIRTSSDGATIAAADIELRGVGDVLGDAQSGGRSSLKLLRVVTDAKLIVRARQLAQDLLTADPTLAAEPELAGAVLDFMRGNEKFLTRS